MVKLCSVEQCTGCGACFNVCPTASIEMFRDSEGYLRPKINHASCVECHLCQKVCPVLNPPVKNNKCENPIALVNLDKEILKKSTSGAIFPLLADWVIKQGGIVFGVVMDEYFNVYHTTATTSDELKLLKGSKYVQSDTKLTYKEVKKNLKEGRIVLYTGTPCQIAGLLTYLGHVDTSKLYTVDVVCHGVPSNTMFKYYIEKLAEHRRISPDDIKQYQFRALDSWGKYTPSFYYRGRIFEINMEENIYTYMFLSSHLHRPCCYQCPYTTPERLGDITIADFWGVGNKKPFLYDTQYGCSLVLLNNPKAHTLFSQISENVYYEHRSWEEAVSVNSQLKHPSRRPKNREKAIFYLMNFSIKKTYKAFYDTPLLRVKRIISNLLRRIHLK